MWTVAKGDWIAWYIGLGTVNKSLERRVAFQNQYWLFLCHIIYIDCFCVHNFSESILIVVVFQNQYYLFLSVTEFIFIVSVRTREMWTVADQNQYWLFLCVTEFILIVSARAIFQKQYWLWLSFRIKCHRIYIDCFCACYLSEAILIVAVFRNKYYLFLSVTEFIFIVSVRAREMCMATVGDWIAPEDRGR